MPAKPLTIGSLHFAKRGDAAAFLQAMLHRYNIGDKVGTADDQVLRDTLTLHPEVAAKVGCGVTHFSVRSADFGTKCFGSTGPTAPQRNFLTRHV